MLPMSEFMKAGDPVWITPYDGLDPRKWRR